MFRNSSLILCLALAAAVFSGCRTPSQVAFDTPASPVPDVMEPEPIEAGVAPPPGSYAPGFDALHYDITLQLPDSGSYIRGITTAHVLLEEPRQDSLVLDFSGLAVENVLAEAEPLPFRHQQGRLKIAVPATKRVGDTLRVAVTYRGHPDDGLILGENIHGRPTAFVDNWPNRARFWFPSIDHPSDKATVRFAVGAGATRQVIANGNLVQEGDAATAWIWENDEPIPTYTMVIGAADFVVDEVGTVCEGATCTEVTTWLFPPDTAAAAPSFRRASDMVAYYNRLVAPFPYDKLAHVQSSTRFGGMENVTAIFYPEEPLSEGRDIEVTVAHETAHQWFGDSVTESDWNHLWLSEGFASYFAALYFEEADGRERFDEIMAGYRGSYLRSDAVHEPIVNPEEDNLFALLNANNYQKGAWVLHMLRSYLGDDTFFEGIRQFYNAHEHGTALTDDLRDALESASGRDLETFFDQWVHAPGYPQLSVEWSWDEQEGIVNVNIDQIQSDQWPTYEMPLELEFTTAAGTERRTAELTGRTTQLGFELESAPTDLIVDPDADWLLEVNE